MVSRQSISDGWEDVGYDNLSVRSLPCSDEDDASIATRTQSEITLSIRAAAQQPLVERSDSLSETTTLPGNGDPRANVDKGKAEETEAAAALPEDPFQDPPDTQDAEDDAVDELLHDGSRDLDLPFLKKTLDSLRGILDDTAALLADLSIPLCDGERPSLLCQQFREQLHDLTPIVSGYAKVWAGSSCELPLDPGLHAWLSGVRVAVLGLQAEAHRAARETNPDAPYALSRICDDLSDYERKMSDFLPIMLADYHEFQTQHMCLPCLPSQAPPTPPPSQPYPIRSSPIDIPQPHATTSRQNPPPHPNRTTPNPLSHPSNSAGNLVYLLRRELYRLKDIVAHTAEVLRSVSSPAVPGSVAVLAQDVAKMYDRLVTSIGLALSNNASEWIESGLSGGMTYAEFVGMDRDCIGDFADQIEETLGVSASGGVCLRRSGGMGGAIVEEPVDPSVVSRELEWAAESGQHGAAGEVPLLNGTGVGCEKLDKLETLGQILEAMFKSVQVERHGR